MSVTVLFHCLLSPSKRNARDLVVMGSLLHCFQLFFLSLAKRNARDLVVMGSLLHCFQL